MLLEAARPDGFFIVTSRASHTEIHCVTADGFAPDKTNIV
jgi:hypothetical protein